MFFCVKKYKKNRQISSIKIINNLITRELNKLSMWKLL